MFTTDCLMPLADYPAGEQTFFGAVPPLANNAAVRADRSSWREGSAGDVIKVLLAVRAEPQLSYRTLIGFTARGGDVYADTPHGQAPAPDALRVLESSATIGFSQDEKQGLYKGIVTLYAPLRTSIHIDWS